MTVVSRAITNCPAASVRRTIPVPLTGRAAFSVTALLPSPEARADSHLHVRQHQSRAGETHVLCGRCFRGRVILPARRSAGRRQGGLELGLSMVAQRGLNDVSMLLDTSEHLLNLHLANEQDH